MFVFVSTMSIVFGAIAVLLALAHVVWTVRLLLIGERAVAVVVANEVKVTTESDGTRAAFVYSVLDFEDSAGRKYRITLATGTAGVKPFSPGSRVEILYPPNHPEKAVMRHFYSLWLFPLAFTASGILGIVGGYLFHAWTSGPR